MGQATSSSPDLLTTRLQTAQEMEFRILLLKVKKALCKDEVKALAFLCTDLLGRNPTSVESASALFSRLVDQDHLSPERPHLLTELLLTIQRNRLVHDLSLSEYTTMNLISKYRKLLYNLSEEITGEDLKDMKFLLNPTLPRRRLKDNTTTLEVFLEMERTGHLSETNLNELEAIIQSVCPVLKEKIAQFKALPVTCRCIQFITPRDSASVLWRGSGSNSYQDSRHWSTCEGSKTGNDSPRPDPNDSVGRGHCWPSKD
uniref:caspase-10-like isoform X2 n=1 Tax=Monopterus albus TaxID=43700 RepID=UPI0009B3DB31|nr:caspase-10-like isoform X2 [Monopterus albus]